MKKYKILVVPSDKSGVGHYRSVNPHINLERLYPDEFHVDIEYEPQTNDDEWLKKYDLVHYHRTLGDYDKMSSYKDKDGNLIEGVLDRLKRLGIPSIMDIDDYWSPGQHHPAYHIIKHSETDKKILNNIIGSQNVLTTTELFAEEIKKYNKNVFVIPNSINPEDKQFKPKPIESKRIRINWTGGSSHKKDLELLNGLVSKLKSDNLLDKVQFVLCGFDTRGYITDINPKTGEKRQRKIQPHETVWCDYEKIFTDNYTTISPEYKKHLLTFSKEEYPNVDGEPYRRAWTKQINSYATHYNMADITLAPLVDNIFNKCKSELKAIESGFYSKALIAQDFGPYKMALDNAYEKGGKINEKGNALLVDSNKNHKQWYQYIKKLINNPELIDILGNNLNKMVTEKYHIDVVSKNRRDLYLKLINNEKRVE